MSSWSSVRIPSKLDNEVDNAYRGAGYPSKSQFVSDAVREKLEKHRLRLPNICEHCGEKCLPMKPGDHIVCWQDPEDDHLIVVHARCQLGFYQSREIQKTEEEGS